MMIRPTVIPPLNGTDECYAKGRVHPAIAYYHHHHHHQPLWLDDTWCVYQSEWNSTSVANTINPRSDSVGGNPKSFLSTQNWINSEDSKQLRLLQKKYRTQTPRIRPVHESQVKWSRSISLACAYAWVWYDMQMHVLAFMLHSLLFPMKTMVSSTWMLQVSWKLATGTPKLTMKGSSSVASPAGFKPRTYLEGSAFHCWEMFSDAKRIQNCSVENLSPRSVFQRLRA